MLVSNNNFDVSMLKSQEEPLVWRVLVFVGVICVGGFITTFLSDPEKARKVGMLLVVAVARDWPAFVAITFVLWFAGFFVTRYSRNMYLDFDKSDKLVEIYNKALPDIGGVSDYVGLTSVIDRLRQPVTRFQETDPEKRANEKISYLTSLYDDLYVHLPRAIKQYQDVDANLLGFHRKTQFAYMDMFGPAIVFILHDNTLADRKIYYWRNGQLRKEDVENLVRSSFLPETAITRAIDLWNDKGPAHLSRGFLVSGFGSDAPDLEARIADNKRWGVVVLSESVNQEALNLLVVQCLGIEPLTK